jgi:multidrug efflux pump subunit AcrB
MRGRKLNRQAADSWPSSVSGRHYGVHSQRRRGRPLEVDQDRARALGLTPQDVSQMLQTLLSGYVVTQYREGIEHIDVVARAVPSERLELDRLPSLTIATRSGVAVPLSQIARLNYEFEEPSLWRRNRDIVLTARGDVVDNVQAPDVTNAVLPKLRSIKACLSGCHPQPLGIVFGHPHGRSPA